MINEIGERVESPPAPLYPPHMIDAPRSAAQEAAFERVKESDTYKAERTVAEEAAEQRAADEEAAAKSAPAKKSARKSAKRGKKASESEE